MSKLSKVISTAQKLINLPYNKFSLENYYSVLLKNKIPAITVDTKEDQPIKLMSGGNLYSRIVASSNLHNKLKSGKKIYIVGKGILFDSGGLDIKPAGHMTDMTDDKAGMIIALSVANYLKGNIIAYCPVTTNFVHTSKITPGDEIKIGKKIVKITNTDAEGRLILAEAITTLNASKDDIIITIATLTGAVGVAIGEEATGVFSPNNDLLSKYSAASYEAKEYAWALPLWEHYQRKYYNGKVIENAIKTATAGATQGAMFVKQFVKFPNTWLHLDIAHSAFGEDGKANGVPIKSLVNFIKNLQ
jgi:leucyl aminopeptidase